MCNSTNNLTLAEANEDDFNVTAYVALSDFKVKAFNFDVNATNGTYGTGKIPHLRYVPWNIHF